MFDPNESPFRNSEVLQILKCTREEFAKIERTCTLSRNVPCHYRADKAFNYPNFFDILTFRLEQFIYEPALTKEESIDIISCFIDRLSRGLEPGRCAIPEDIGGIVFRVTEAIKADLFGWKLREFSRYGEHLLNSDSGFIRLDQRENHLCSIAVALLHRTMPVFYATAIQRAATDKVTLVDQFVAVCQGKLCTYIPEQLLGAIDDQELEHEVY